MAGQPRPPGETGGTLRERLQRHRLASPPQEDVAAVVRRFGAMQAQDYAAATWAVGLRSDGLTAAAIDAALADGSIVRTHILRPTWHFVARDDLRWLIALSGPRVLATTASRQAQLGIDDAMIARAEATVTDALRGGNALTRAELLQALTATGIALDADPQRGPWLLSILELRGVICSGPKAGKQFTWALLDERVPETDVPSRDESLAMLARRYFGAHGPATLKDFAWWSGLTLTDCRKAIALAGDALRMAGDASPALVTASEPPATDAEPPELTLLPAFDEYTVGYAGRRALLADPDASPDMSGMDLLAPVMIDGDGRVVGTWRRELAKGGMTLTPRFFRTPTPAQETAFARAADRYRAFWSDHR